MWIMLQLHLETLDKLGILQLPPPLLEDRAILQIQREPLRTCPLALHLHEDKLDNQPLRQRHHHRYGAADPDQLPSSSRHIKKVHCTQTTPPVWRRPSSQNSNVPCPTPATPQPGARKTPKFWTPTLHCSAKSSRRRKSQAKNADMAI